MSRSDLDKFPTWARENLPKLARRIPKLLGKGLHLRTLDQLAGFGWFAMPDFERAIAERPHKKKFYLNKETLRNLPPPRHGVVPRLLVPVLQDRKGRPFILAQYAAMAIKGGGRTLKVMVDARPLSSLRKQGAAPWIIAMVRDTLKWFVNELRRAGRGWPYLIVDLKVFQHESRKAIYWCLDGLASCFDKGVQEWFAKVKRALRRGQKGKDDLLKLLRIDPAKFMPPQD